MTETFHWEHKGLDRCRFEAYTKLLRLRHGGQASDPVPFASSTEGIEEDKPSDDVDSVKGQPLAIFDDEKLKRAFLDRLSELMSLAKGGHQVAATLMIQSQNGAEITVARNCGFKENDKTFLKQLQCILVNISRHGTYVTFDHENNELLQLLLAQYESRIHYYLSKFRQALEPNHEELATCMNGSPLGEDIATLLSISTSNSDDLSPIVLQAYRIKSSYNLAEFETLHQGNPALGAKLAEAIHYLGRPFIASQTFIRAAQRVEGFDNLQIRCAELSTISNTAVSRGKNPATRPWTVAQTFKSLGLEYTNDQVKIIMQPGGKRAQGYTKATLANKFHRLKTANSEMHAEIQLMLDLARRKIPFSTPFPYIGCSKHSCLLCAEFISSVGLFSTRGCHGKVYNLWMVPEQNELEKSSTDAIYSAVQKLEHRPRDVILERVEPRLHSKESTVGGSSIATTIPQTNNQHLSNLIRKRLHDERGHLMLDAVIERADSPEYEEVINQEIHQSTPNEDIDSWAECQRCFKATSRHCSLCGRDWYCSETCQDKMLSNHIFGCRKRPLTTADFLYENCIQDEVPDDPEVLADFGFNRCKTQNEVSHLLGVYTGLFKYLDVPSGHVDAWRRENTLLANITRCFQEVPESSRGSYYPWLLRNTHVLEQSAPDSAGMPFGPGYGQRLVENATQYLEDEDKDKAFHQLEPVSKKESFLLFAFALDNGNPNSAWDNADIWYAFGFSVSVGSSFDMSPRTLRHAEGRLGSMYNSLIAGNQHLKGYFESLGGPYYGPTGPNSPTCPFGEFWRAYDAFTLPTVFDKYGKGNEIDRAYPHLRAFLSCPEHERPLVWRLCHYISVDDVNAVGALPQLRDAAETYGIGLRLNPRDRLIMYEFYKELLGAADPLHLQEACDTGTLLRFSKQCLKKGIDHRVCSLLAELDVSKRFQMRLAGEPGHIPQTQELPVIQDDIPVIQDDIPVNRSVEESDHVTRPTTCVLF